MSPPFVFGDRLDSPLFGASDFGAALSVFAAGADSDLDAAGELELFESPPSLFESLGPESGPDVRCAFFP